MSTKEKGSRPAYIPELNRLTRMMNLDLIDNLNLTGSETKVLLLMFREMNSLNMFLLKKLRGQFHRNTIKLTLDKLSTVGAIFVRDDKQVMVNPNLCMVKRAGKEFHRLREMWTGRRKVNE